MALPPYFEALNRDFKYQLAGIRMFAQAIIKQEIHDNHLVVATNQPNVRVSWQVTAVRNDPYARAHQLVVEQPKVCSDLGRYHRVVRWRPRCPSLGASSDLRAAD